MNFRDNSVTPSRTDCYWDSEDELEPNSQEPMESSFSPDKTWVSELLSKPFQWQEDGSSLRSVETVVIIETRPLLKFGKQCLFPNMRPVQTFPLNSVTLFQYDPATVFIAFDEKGMLGQQVTEYLSKWLIHVKNIICLRSEHSGFYYGPKDNESSFFVRKLASKEAEKYPFALLPSPNIVKGICGSVLSFCVTMKKPCCAYIIYLNEESSSSNFWMVIKKILPKYKFHITADTALSSILDSNAYL